MDKVRPTGKRPLLPLVEQFSAGGVAYRPAPAGIEIAIVQVLPELRWQLPKGMIDPGETREQAALREVREEAGVEAELVGPIATTEYWFQAAYGGQPRRYHKYVHWFLMRYISGSVDDHDHEVAEARWASPEAALRLLAFKNEREIVEQAVAMTAKTDLNNA
jgi:8-oxo-dGTP diphosphatase